MKHRHLFHQMLWLFLLLPAISFAQGTLADYDRAAGLRDKFQYLTVNAPERANWIGTTSRFWYRKSVKGGYEFVLFDAATLAKRPAFDHEKLAVYSETIAFIGEEGGFECPNHGAEFDSTGHWRGGRSTGDLDQYAVAYNGGNGTLSITSL